MAFMMAFGFCSFSLLHLLGEGWFEEWGITIRCYAFALLGRRVLGCDIKCPYALFLPPSVLGLCVPYDRLSVEE